MTSALSYASRGQRTLWMLVNFTREAGRGFLRWRLTRAGIVLYVGGSTGERNRKSSLYADDGNGFHQCAMPSSYARLKDGLAIQGGELRATSANGHNWSDSLCRLQRF